MLSVFLQVVVGTFWKVCLVYILTWIIYSSWTLAYSCDLNYGANIGANIGAPVGTSVFDTSWLWPSCGVSLLAFTCSFGSSDNFDTSWLLKRCGDGSVSFALFLFLEAVEFSGCLRTHFNLDISQYFIVWGTSATLFGAVSVGHVTPIGVTTCVCVCVRVCVWVWVSVCVEWAAV